MKELKSACLKRAYIEVPDELRTFLEKEARRRHLDVNKFLIAVFRAGIASVCGTGVSGNNAAARGVLKHEAMKSIQRPRQHEKVSRKATRKAGSG